MCCACDGSCNHVGPHSFCPSHGGQALTFGTTTTTNTVVDPFPCPLCGGPRPWEAWFNKTGSGCRHAD